MKDIKFSLLGLIVFDYVKEDRRPDLTQEQARLELGYKFKHTIFFRCFNKTISLTIRSISPGIMWVNGEEQ